MENFRKIKPSYININDKILLQKPVLVDNYWFFFFVTCISYQWLICSSLLLSRFTHLHDNFSPYYFYYHSLHTLIHILFSSLHYLNHHPSHFTPCLYYQRSDSFIFVLCKQHFIKKRNYQIKSSS